MKIACTECERVTEEEGVVGWIETAPVGVSLRTWHDEMSVDELFCSSACLVTYFTRMARPERERSEG